MSFRSTLALETRLSSFRPLIPLGTSGTRRCLLSQRLSPGGLPAVSRLHFNQMRFSSDTAGARPVEEDETSDANAARVIRLVSTRLRRRDEEQQSGDLQISSFPHDAEYEINSWKVAYQDVFHGTEEERRLAMGTTLRIEQRAAALRFASRRSPEELRGCYVTMSKSVRRTQLADILVGCLLTGAEITLRVLEGLPVLSNDFNIRMDCLLKLRRDRGLWFEIEKSRGASSLKDKFYKQLKLLRERRKLPLLSLRAGHAALILEEATATEQGSRFFARYLKAYSDREAPVVLKFVDFFTKWGDADQALDALCVLNPEELGASDKHILSRCMNLLKLDTIDNRAGSKNFKILPQLLALGIKPDIPLHNMIIMNAIKSNVSRVGWDLFRYLKTEDLETDAVTHLLLMKDAFAQRDVSGLNEILSAIHKCKDLYHNPYLVGCTMNIIRIIYMYEKHASHVETFSHILSIHNRAWLPDIYVSLGMLQPSHLSMIASRSTASESPPPEIIAWTILQYCLAQVNHITVDRLWQHLTHAIKTSDPQILPAAALENLYAGFIVFYGRSPQTLGKAVDVVQFMLDNPHCMPTGFTWTRLLCGYLRQGQHVEAEQIREVMKKKGIRIGSKEFAFLLENWPDSEVVARARRAVAGIRNLDLEIKSADFDEELFESVDERASLSDEPARWDGILDLRKQAVEGEKEVGKVLKSVD
jgi:pentatricopeptide repeat protein